MGLLTILLAAGILIAIVVAIESVGKEKRKLKPSTVSDFLDHPNVRRQLDGFQRLFMRETIMALWNGTQPPHSVGGYGTLTKKKLIIEWNDDWQAEMDKLSEYHDISYELLFDIKPDGALNKLRTVAGLGGGTEPTKGAWLYHTNDDGEDHRIIEADDSTTHVDWIHIYGGKEKERS